MLHISQVFDALLIEYPIQQGLLHNDFAMYLKSTALTS